MFQYVDNDETDNGYMKFADSIFWHDIVVAGKMVHSKSQKPAKM